MSRGPRQNLAVLVLLSVDEGFDPMHRDLIPPEIGAKRLDSPREVRISPPWAGPMASCRSAPRERGVCFKTRYQVHLSALPGRPRHLLPHVHCTRTCAVACRVVEGGVQNHQPRLPRGMGAGLDAEKV